MFNSTGTFSDHVGSTGEELYDTSIKGSNQERKSRLVISKKARITTA
jgi:hypothetical protein